MRSLSIHRSHQHRPRLRSDSSASPAPTLPPLRSGGAYPAASRWDPVLHLHLPRRTPIELPQPGHQCYRWRLSAQSSLAAMERRLGQSSSADHGGGPPVSPPSFPHRSSPSSPCRRRHSCCSLCSHAGLACPLPPPYGPHPGQPWQRTGRSWGSFHFADLPQPNRSRVADIETIRRKSCFWTPFGTGSRETAPESDRESQSLHSW
jgi:hypothetical protein